MGCRRQGDGAVQPAADPGRRRRPAARAVWLDHALPGRTHGPRAGSGRRADGSGLRRGVRGEPRARGGRLERQPDRERLPGRAVRGEEGHVLRDGPGQDRQPRQAARALQWRRGAVLLRRKAALLRPLRLPRRCSLSTRLPGALSRRPEHRCSPTRCCSTRRPSMRTLASKPSWAPWKPCPASQSTWQSDQTASTSARLRCSKPNETKSLFTRRWDLTPPAPAPARS